MSDTSLASAGVDRRFLMAGAFAALAGCMTGADGAGVSVETFDIWPGAPPGGEDVTVVEQVIERSADPAVRDRAAIHVRRPRVKVFRPSAADGSGVLILPGGGYRRVVLDKEGDETAMCLAAHGVTCAVLVYRLPEDGWSADRDAPLQDAQRAMRLLRGGGLAAGLDPGRIGALGFSAGGHLAASLALRSGEATYQLDDAMARVSARPDFAGLIYPALSMRGPSPGRSMIAPDLALMVTAAAPPMFLLHAADDRTVPVGESLRMYEALNAAGAPADLHVFDAGGHGFGVARAQGMPVEVWPELFFRWGESHGHFRRGVVRKI